MKFITVGGQATANGISAAVGRLTNSDNLECTEGVGLRSKKLFLYYDTIKETGVRFNVAVS